MSASTSSGTPDGVPTLDLARTPGHLIRRAQREHNLLWAEHVGPEPTGPQFAVLSGAARRPGLDQKTLGQLASLDKSTTTDIVRRLVRRGWLTAAPDPDDRRRKVLHLSPPAQMALTSLTAAAARVQQHLLAPLTAERRRDLVTDLALLGYEGDPPARPREDVDAGLDLATTPGHLIRRAQQAYVARWTHTFGGSLTGPQYALLCALANHEPADQSTLGEAAALDRTSTTEIVERLTSAQLVIAVTNARDRRRKALRLSPLGRRELPDITRRAAEVQAALFDLLPGSSRERLLDNLGAIAYRSETSGPPAAV
ncbi:winged helix-turn-helix transcriptional regulator [Pseudonocardia sp. ICBG1122]|nr:winged helix-turn-helix transcriptional regulator [Pseudonocardia pini]